MTARLTIALIPDADSALDRLCEATGLKKVDVINRAIQVYEAIDDEQRAGKTWLVRDSVGNEERVRFL